MFLCRICFFVVGFTLIFFFLNKNKKSIFYKMKLPMIVVLNKSDKANTEKIVKWMKDYEEFLVN